MYVRLFCFVLQAEDGIRDLVRSRGLGDVYKRQRAHLQHVGVARNELDVLGRDDLGNGGQADAAAGFGEQFEAFFAEALDLRILQTIHSDESQLTLTGYPEGLPCWEIRGGVEALKDIRFWREYDAILEGFLDFYRTFFSQVSSRNAPRLEDLHYPEAVDRVLLFDNDFLGTARRVRERCIREPAYANSIRWQPAFKQLIYRHDSGKLLVTISQNSIGNAITELLGVVVRRVPDAAAYASFEPRLLDRLLTVRERLIAADLGDGIATADWPAAPASSRA